MKNSKSFCARELLAFANKPLLGILSLLTVTIALTQSAHAQCQRASTTVSGRLYVSQAFGTGLNDSVGVKAAAAEALEVCRGALGAPNTNFVRYANVAPSTFSSPGNNIFCYLVGSQRVCVNARDAGNPPHINSLSCFCIPSQCADGIDNDGDGAADLADFSCGGQPTNNNESSPLSQCQDGQDNDGDGAVDLADFSCQNNRQRNDEANPKSQCQDAADNDSDGAVDLADFSCQNNKQRNDETNPKPQCNDGADNDGDGAVDAADFSCQNDKQKNDESQPLAQCQDGQDNDGDGAADLNDFSCENNKQKNSEATPNSQCQDGLDNDSDGAIDLADTSCQGNKQKNDEAFPRAQCDDGSDNDADGAIDLADFSCGGNKQRNDESVPLAQCQDGQDNDADGATDLADFSCGNNKQKDNEATPAAQCADGIDNDNDGAVDLADFSCGGNKQKNDEATPKSQCQDGLDNDGNSLIDGNDPGCTGSQDNDESGVASILALAPECVLENADGTRTAYFSYVNPLTRDIGGGFDSSFDSGATRVRSPSTFKQGTCRGCASATFTGASVTWTVQGSGVGRATTTAQASGPKCSNVTPLFGCQGYKAGKIRVKAGWNNTNGFSVFLPIGALNNFSPGKADIGQPTELLTGNIPAAFDVNLDSGVTSTTWKLNGLSVDNQKIPVCNGECIDTPTGTITGNLNAVAQQLAETTRKAARMLESIAPQDAVDAERARGLATGYVQTAQALTLQIPAVIKNCPEAPQFCETVDRGATIDQLKSLYATARNTVKRVVSRAYFRKGGETNRKDPLIRKALSLEKQGLAELAKLPRFATECK